MGKKKQSNSNSESDGGVTLLIFPHQLFEDHPALSRSFDQIVLIEDSLFFGDWNYGASFHKQKLAYHRATMKRRQVQLEKAGHTVHYLDYDDQPHSLTRQLAQLNAKSLLVADPVDFILSKRLSRFSEDSGTEIEVLTSPAFLNEADQNRQYRSGKKRWFMADFYKFQRRRLNVLMNGDQPEGDQWSFDEDNRKKIPKKLLKNLPQLPSRSSDSIESDAVDYVNENFSQNPGELKRILYPTSFQQARDWLQDFLKNRFEKFGDYEDAIIENESWLWHSVLTPMLNIGLLTPRQILDATLKHLDENDIPLNSAEGFIRQIIGWREFIRATYEDLGVEMRTNNHWKHHRKIPTSFYRGETGIEPVDNVIKRVLATGYCHHIERLMVLGGMMFLCEFDPEEVYQWFMDLFIDSYDWVMVPNVFAMSQHADGGLITTKPYFSGSSYILKMSHYSKGEWCETWDGLYWRWIDLHADDLAKNPRWAMMCSMAKKMDAEKMKAHHRHAEDFLNRLDAQ